MGRYWTRNRKIAVAAGFGALGLAVAAMLTTGIVAWLLVGLALNLAHRAGQFSARIEPWRPSR